MTWPIGTHKSLSAERPCKGWCQEAQSPVMRSGPPFTPSISLRILIDSEGKRVLQQRWTRIVDNVIEEEWRSVPIVTGRSSDR